MGMKSLSRENEAKKTEPPHLKWVRGWWNTQEQKWGWERQQAVLPESFDPAAQLADGEGMDKEIMPESQ